jgi:hypothetical protein
MIYFVVLLIITIIFLSLVILRFKSKETFILDDASNKPKIDSYQLNNYNYLTEVKKFEIIHKGENAGSQFCIGTLYTKNGSFRTTIFMKQKGGGQLLQELRLFLLFDCVIEKRSIIFANFV